PLGVRLLQEGLGSLRGAIGTPAQVSDLVRRYEEAGVDQVIFVLQAGRNRHEHICESLELFAERVMPPFLDGRDQREAAKAERLETAIGAALSRREPARELSSPYVIDEQAEVSAARRRAHTSQSPREMAASARVRARGAARHPALRIRFPLSDFVRVAAGTIDPAVPLLRDRASFEGDFSLAAKLPEMFGAPSPY